MILTERSPTLFDLPTPDVVCGVDLTARPAPIDDWPTVAEGGHWREICRVEIEGVPKAQPRGKSYAIKLCPGGHKFDRNAARCPRCGRPGEITTRMRDPGTAEEWKALVAEAFRPHRGAEPLDAILRVDTELFLPRPKSFADAVVRAYGGRKRIPAGPVLCPVKPDRDNLDKAILDGLKVWRFLRDDAIVTDGAVRKFYHALGGRPGARVRVMVWEAR